MYLWINVPLDQSFPIIDTFKMIETKKSAFDNEDSRSYKHDFFTFSPLVPCIPLGPMGPSGPSFPGTPLEPALPMSPFGPTGPCGPFA